MGELFFFDPDELKWLALSARDRYRSARPFPHAVFDDFLPLAVAEDVLAEFPAPDEARWLTYHSEKEKKLASPDERVMGPRTRHLLAQFNSAAAIDFLGTLTGIGGLVPDPHYFGGGMHQIVAGGYLKVHADFNVHPRTRMIRRLNLLLYLNKDWPEEYGGALELWNVEMTAAEARILPAFNRCVVFSTSDTSFHGHPEPLTCPPGRSRKSLALYYYTQAPSVVTEHNTLFRARPAEDASVPADRTPSGSERGAGLRRVAGRWLPPAVADRLRRLRAMRQAGRAG